MTDPDTPIKSKITLFDVMGIVVIIVTVLGSLVGLCYFLVDYYEMTVEQTAILIYVIFFTFLDWLMISCVISLVPADNWRLHLFCVPVSLIIAAGTYYLAEGINRHIVLNPEKHLVQLSIVLGVGFQLFLIILFDNMAREKN